MITYDKQATCKMCGSGNIVFHMLRIDMHETSHWYDCRSCGYSSNGRRTLAEAEADTVIKTLDQTEQR